MKIQSYDSFKYLEVFKILQWKDGAVFKTKSTGCYIAAEDQMKLDHLKWLTTSISTTLQRQPEIELDVRKAEEFS